MLMKLVMMISFIVLLIMSLSIEEELSEVEAVTTPVKKSIFEVEIIDQKRKPKRKAAVEELFQSLKKKRRYEVRFLKPFLSWCLKIVRCIV